MRLGVAAGGDAFQLTGIPKDFHHADFVDGFDARCDRADLLLGIKSRQQGLRRIGFNGEQACQTNQIHCASLDGLIHASQTSEAAREHQRHLDRRANLLCKIQEIGFTCQGGGTLGHLDSATHGWRFIRAAGYFDEINTSLRQSLDRL